jgi:hypothetical protein
MSTVPIGPPFGGATPTPELPPLGRSFPQPSRSHAALASRAAATSAVPSHAPVPAAKRAAPAATLSGDRIVARLAPPEPQRRQALLAALLAHVPSSDRAAAQTAIPAILEAARKTGSSDPNRIGYLLATAQKESDFGVNMSEYGHPPSWFNERYGGCDGNRPGTNDGFAYRGRGYVQTTHAGRYAELSHRLGLPDVPSIENGKPTRKPALVAQPERLLTPKLAAEALVIGVDENLYTHNRAAAMDRTIPVGRKPGAVDFYTARGLVNGIVEKDARAIAGNATMYAEILDRYRHSVLGARP